MNLYAWQPNGHGPLSFFVMAENEESAKEAVRTHIKNQLADPSDRFGGYECRGWPDDYQLTVFAAWQVAENDNS